MGVVKKYAYDGVFRCFDMCDIIENYKHDELCEEKLFISLAALKDMVDSSIRDKYDDDNDDTVVPMEESKIISRRACQKKLTAIFNFVILIMDRNADDRVDQRRNFYHGYAAQGSRGRQGADRGAPCKDGRTEEKRHRTLPCYPARRRA